MLNSDHYELLRSHHFENFAFEHDTSYFAYFNAQCSRCTCSVLLIPGGCQVLNAFSPKWWEMQIHFSFSGMTVAAIPLMSDNGVIGFTNGINSGSAPAKFPLIARWRYADKELMYVQNPGEQCKGTADLLFCALLPEHLPPCSRVSKSPRAIPGETRRRGIGSMSVAPRNDGRPVLCLPLGQPRPASGL